MLPFALQHIFSHRGPGGIWWVFTAWLNEGGWKPGVWICFEGFRHAKFKSIKIILCYYIMQSNHASYL